MNHPLLAAIEFIEISGHNSNAFTQPYVDVWASNQALMERRYENDIQEKGR